MLGVGKATLRKLYPSQARLSKLRFGRSSQSQSKMRLGSEMFNQSTVIYAEGIQASL